MKTLLPLLIILPMLIISCEEDDPALGPNPITTSKQVDIPDQNYAPGEIEILINGAYDGGGWWFPQGVDCNPNKYHQGKVLYDLLISMDYKVDAICRRESTSLGDYENLLLLIVAGSYEYVAADAALEIKEYVENGGNLLLMLTHSNHSDLGKINSLSKFFDLTFAPTNGSEIRFNDHPIANGIPNLPEPYGGMGLWQKPEDIEVIANFGPDVYIDENENGEMDENETSAPVFIGAKRVESGKILFSGDLFFWYGYPDLFRNAVDWFELK